MNKNTIDNLIENLFYVFLIIHKKLLKIDLAEIGTEFNLSRLHIAIMGIVHEENTLPISEIAKRLMVPKPQMSLLINQLVNAGLVERHLNQNDRRISDITMTAKGQSAFKRCEELLKNNFRKKLAYLGEQDLEELSESLQKLRDIGAKWEISKNKPESCPQASMISKVSL